MPDEKVSLEVTKARRRIELRDLALAAVYPQTRSSTPLPAITTDLQALPKRQREIPNPPANEAKPWKKPWDR
jgi:hypothetical protein